jgi:hypothetical protein
LENKKYSNKGSFQHFIEDSFFIEIIKKDYPQIFEENLNFTFYFLLFLSTFINKILFYSKNVLYRTTINSSFHLIIFKEPFMSL